MISQPKTIVDNLKQIFAVCNPAEHVTSSSVSVECSNENVITPQKQ